MSNVWTILKRELGAYFNSSLAYIYLIVFIVINNGLFMTRFFLAGKADMRAFFDTLPLSLFVFIPAITMRLWAEDKKENTFELLMTFPLKPIELVLGKFLASFVFYLLSLVNTLTIPIILSMAGRPDIGVIVGGYLGALLIGSLFLAIGIFISGLTKEQIVAFILTIISCFVLYLIGTDFIASFLDGWISGLGTFIKNYIGSASHIISFNKGVIDFRDIIYFAAMIFICLFLNGLFFEGRMRPKAKLVFTAAVIVCLVGGVIFNWLIHDLSIARFDVTEGKIYTVSQASKKILSNLKIPVFIKVYITPSEKMPTALKTLEQEITGKLDELKIISGNNLKYKVFYIEASKLMEQQKQNFPGAGQDVEESLEKTLQDKGIMPFQVESIDKDELGVKLVYSAISVIYKEKSEEILPRIVPQNLPDLEYLLLSRILKLTLEKKPKIALFSPLKNQEITLEMSQLLSTMGQAQQKQYEDDYKSILPLATNNGYEVRRVALTKENPLPDELNTLLVMNPGLLTDTQLYDINKFLYQGGSVLIAAQGFDYSFQLTPPSGIEILPQKLDLSINKLLQKLGIKINEEMLMDEGSQMVNVSTGQNVGPFSLSIPVKVPNQIIIKDETMNKSTSFMNRLPSLFYLWGSSLDISDDIVKQSGLKKTVMFSSGQKSWKLPFESGFLKRDLLQFPKTGSAGKFVLGLMLEGQFNDSFAKEMVPAEGEKAAEGAEQLKQKTSGLSNPKPGKLIIIGCSKMFSDQVMSNPGNLSLFANIIDGLTLGDDIIQIRSKTPISRDIKAVSDARKLLYRFITIFLVPILLIIFASIRLFLRKKEKQFYLLARE